MTIPTIEQRLKRRFIAMTTDPAVLAALRAELPEGWEMVETLELDALGGFQDIILYRFLLLDLDERAAFDPLEVIRKLRMELALNIAIFCFGGDAGVRDEARLNRADRFFERDEIAQKMKLFCQQYGWGK